MLMRFDRFFGLYSWSFSLSIVLFVALIKCLSFESLLNYLPGAVRVFHRYLYLARSVKPTMSHTKPQDYPWFFVFTGASMPTVLVGTYTFLTNKMTVTRPDH